MLHEFALAPGLFHPRTVQYAERVELNLRHVLLVLCESGLIADLSHDDWLSQVRRNVEGIQSQALRRDLMELLARAADRRRLVPYPQPRIHAGATDEGWIRAALLAADQLRAVITDKATKETAFANDRRIVPVEEAIGSTWMEIPHSINLRKDVAGMTRFLEPLLRHASRVSLADPYMSCRSNTSLTTLRILIDLMQNRKRGMANIALNIHCGDPTKDQKHPEDPDARIRGWRDAVDMLDSRPHTVSISFWGDDDEIFHDRYIFTDQCAVTVPAGLGCYSSRRANTTQCTRLMYDQLADVHRSFQPNTSPYRLLRSAMM